MQVYFLDGTNGVGLGFELGYSGVQLILGKTKINIQQILGYQVKFTFLHKTEKGLIDLHHAVVFVHIQNALLQRRDYAYELGRFFLGTFRRNIQFSLSSVDDKRS